MDYLNKFKQYLNKLDEELEDEIEEANVTANMDGGEGPAKTPNAFSDNSKKSKKKQKDNATASTGFDVVNDSLYMKMMKLI